MNQCFLMELIISNLNFKFIISGKHDSIIQFSLLLSNGSIIKVIAFNELADFCYKKLKKDEWICVQGSLNHKTEVVADYIEVYR